MAPPDYNGGIGLAGHKIDDLNALLDFQVMGKDRHAAVRPHDTRLSIPTAKFTFSTPFDGNRNARIDTHAATLLRARNQSALGPRIPGNKWMRYSFLRWKRWHNPR